MSEKDKNCIKFSMRSMTVTHKPYQEDTEIDVTGMIPGHDILAMKNPFDIPCDVVVIPKREFEKLQANVGINEELAKQWEINYNLLLKKTGFDTVEELVNYLDSEAECDTLCEAISSLVYSVKFARDERRSLSKKLDECEKDYISERDKATVLEQEAKIYAKALQEWKEDTGCPSPSSAKTLIESMEAALRGSNRVMVKELENSIDEWQKATGRIDPDAAKQYIDRLEGRLRKIHSYSVDW